MKGKDGFEHPVTLTIDEKTLTDSYAKIVTEPWENGYGHTVGNALRRVLLSSMEGVAVTSIKIDGVAHEFMSMPDVMEDVMDIVLNIKKLKFNSTVQLPKTLELKADTAGPVTAANIRDEAGIEVLNKDQLICTLDKDRPFRMELTIDRGRGFRVADENKNEDQPLGTIPVDSLFSPVEKVHYDVQATRVGQHTDYDRLEMEIFTDRRILPIEALSKSATILRDLFSVFISDNVKSNNELQDPSISMNEEEKNLLELLKKDVSELELSVRAVHCLECAEIKYIGELVEKSDNQMLHYKNFGRKSLDEIKQKLNDMGLKLEMTLPDSVKDELQRITETKKQSSED